MWHTGSTPGEVPPHRNPADSEGPGILPPAGPFDASGVRSTVPAMAPPAPSGRQTVLSSGDQEVVLVEVGGGIRTYTAGGIDVLDGYAEDEQCSGGRGQPLLPWPNRLDGGRFSFDGIDEQAPLTEAASGNAIHGLTRWLSWSVLEAGTDHATLGVTLRPQPGWAWTLDLTASYRLTPSGLQVTTGAVNRSDRPSPFGAGWHPYMLAPSGRVDDFLLQLPAGSWEQTNERGIPTGRASVEGSPWDFREAKPIGDVVMDLAFTDLTRGSDGSVAVRLSDSLRHWNLCLRLGPGWDWLMVFTGDTLAHNPRRGLALEPMTGPANLLRSGDGLVTLPPGGRFQATWSIEPGWL